MWIEICKNCKERFSITQHGGDFGIADREAITCPHCQALWGHEKSAGVFATAAVTPEQENLPVGRGADVKAKLAEIRARR